MKFKLFNLNKDGKGVDPNEDTTPNVSYFFKSLWRKLTKLISINLVAVLQFVPLIAALLINFWSETEPTITDVTFPVLSGIATMAPSPANRILWMLASVQKNIPAVSWGLRWGTYALIALFALTFGWCNVGFTYLMREMVNGRPVFIFSDLKHAIKRNFKQGFLLGLLDFLFIFILGTNIYTMGSGFSAGFLGDFFYVANVAIAIIYIIMRFYMYLMLVTFDMKIFKILKNALIFVMLGIKRNLLAILWILVMLAINFAVFSLFIPLGIIIPILYIVSFPMFTTAYAAYPIIQRYMIDASPYSEGAESEESAVTDAVYSDNVGLPPQQVWEAFLARGGADGAECYSIKQFDDDNTSDLVLRGIKKACSTPHPLYASQNIPLPQVGEYNVIVNSRGHGICIIQTTKVYVVSFEKITEDHIKMEGGNNKNLKTWLQTHEVLFEKKLAAVGQKLSGSTRIVCEQFQVVYIPE